MQTIFHSNHLLNSSKRALLQWDRAMMSQRASGLIRFFSEEKAEGKPQPEKEESIERINPAKVKTASEFKRLLKGLELSEDQAALLNKAAESMTEELKSLQKLKTEKVEKLPSSSHHDGLLSKFLNCFKGKAAAKETAETHLIETTKKIDEIRKFLVEEKQETERITIRYKGEVEKEKVFAISGFAKDLLEIGDNLDRALDSAKHLENKGDSLYDGVKITKGSFSSVMARHGVKRMNSLGEKFNPELHEALFEVSMPGKEPGQVVHVQQDGYTIKDRLLRAAKVGVSK